MTKIKSICWGCDHFCINNDDGLTQGCRAFPDGIPFFIGDKHSHDEIFDKDCTAIKSLKLKPQVGDYVYTPAKREKNIFGRKIEIYQ